MPITEIDPVWVERTRERIVEMRAELEELMTQLDEWEAQIAADNEQG